MVSKIPCGGFYYDVNKLTFVKDENGRVYLTIPDDVLTGIKGDKGDKGDPFTISHIYTSYEEMVTDHDNQDIEINSFILIESGTNDGEHDGELYIKDIHGFDYITNLTGAQGIKGDKGDTGSGVPHGGTTGQYLVKTTDHDFATHWETLDLSDYAKIEDIENNILPTITEEEDNNKVATVINGVWDMKHIEFGEIIHTSSSVSIGSDSAPRLTEHQVQTAYNAFVAGKSVAISNVAGNKYYAVVSVDSSDRTDIKIRIVCDDKYLITYNHLGLVSSYKEILDGEIVTLSREYATAPNDHGYYREFSPNPQGKIWVECGVFIKTVALSVGSNVPLPVTFEDGNFHVQVTVMEMGNYSAKAYRSGNNRSINVLVTDYYGTPKAVDICVEAKGWKNI